MKSWTKGDPSILVTEDDQNIRGACVGSPELRRSARFTAQLLDDRRDAVILRFGGTV